MCLINLQQHRTICSTLAPLIPHHSPFSYVLPCQSYGKLVHGTSTSSVLPIIMQMYKYHMMHLVYLKIYLYEPLKTPVNTRLFTYSHIFLNEANTLIILTY